MSTGSKRIHSPLDVRKIVQALPEDISNGPAAFDPMAEMIAHISTRTVPVKSMARMWILGSMQAKIVAGYLAYALRSSFSGKTKKQELLNEAHLSAALKLFGTMGYLRGAIMKIGQMLGNLPDVLPREFSEVLSSLHFEAPPMHYSMVREVFLNELGKAPEEVFSFFDRKAFAAASLGQVHRARLKTGEDVAVKIQYPSMACTIQADIRNLKFILAPMRLKREWKYIADHLQDIEYMLQKEADYEKEAAFMMQAYEIFKDCRQVVVPRYYEQYSATRVITMDYLDGKTVTDFMKTNPSSEERNHFGELISLAIMRLSYHSRQFYTDPHPGNFLLMKNGQLGFIDFGSYRTLTAEEWEQSNNGEKALMFTKDDELLRKVIASGCMYKEANEVDQDRMDLLIKIARWFAEPAQEDKPFDFSDNDWFQRGVDINLAIVRQHQSRFEPTWTWTNRTLIGHRTLMYHLKCTFNFRKLYIENNPFAAKEHIQ